MKKNIGSLDRIIRIVLGLLFIGLYFAHVISGAIAVILLVIAVVFIATALIGTCPIYLGLGMSTKNKEEAQSQ